MKIDKESREAIRIAVAAVAMHALLAHTGPSKEQIAKAALAQADALLEELRI